MFQKDGAARPSRHSLLNAGSAAAVAAVVRFVLSLSTVRRRTLRPSPGHTECDPPQCVVLWVPDIRCIGKMLRSTGERWMYGPPSHALDIAFSPRVSWSSRTRGQRRLRRVPLPRCLIARSRNRRSYPEVLRKHTPYTKPSGPSRSPLARMVDGSCCIANCAAA
ncbi:hypothetical protein BV20DRAFT_132713 [Pilatotrama ljubarskyi]|nr:hypothetical protein BV20DRAFT_132713 [Pilatotrama ljubarskyi]